MCKILSRIKAIADHEGIPISTIEKRIGASRGVLSRAIANGTDIQSKWLELICENYRNYSGEWLLTGRGDMLKSEDSADAPIEVSTNIPSPGEVGKNITRQEMRPRIPLEAAAGTLSLLTQSVTEADCEYFPVVPLLPSYDFTIGVKGDSMEPEFKAGDEVACRLVRQNAYIQWGRPYVIDSYDGIVLKRIQDGGECVICTSDNPRYGAFKIPKAEIYHMALVVGLIRQY